MQRHPYFSKEDARRVGDSLKVDWKHLELDQFCRGMDIELEHGRDNPVTAVTHDDALLSEKIALAHLNELPDYYTRLAKREQEAEALWKTDVSV